MHTHTYVQMKTVELMEGSIFKEGHSGNDLLDRYRLTKPPGYSDEFAGKILHNLYISKRTDTLTLKTAKTFTNFCRDDLLYDILWSQANWNDGFRVFANFKLAIMANCRFIFLE